MGWGWTACGMGWCGVGGGPLSCGGCTHPGTHPTKLHPPCPPEHPSPPASPPHTTTPLQDIAYLLHEPLLKKARELAAYEKKVRRALNRHNKQLAAQLAARRPTYRLDHLVRER